MANEVAVALPFKVDYSGKISFTSDQKVVTRERADQ